MQIVLNMDSIGYVRKPKGKEAAISDRLKNERGIRVLEDPDELIDAIRQGFTFTPAQMGGTLEQQKEKDAKGHNIHNLKEFWINQQIIVADIDNGEKVKGKLIPNERILTPEQAIDACKARGIDPYVIYKTFNYSDECPRYRVVIVLSDPITDYEEAADLVSSFRYVFNEQTQELKEEPERFVYVNACADSTINPVSMIYGSTSDCILYHSRSITPLERVRALPKEPALPVKTPPKSNAKKLTRSSGGAHLGALQSLKEQLNADISTFDLGSYIESSTNSRKSAHGFYDPCPMCQHNGCLTVDGAIFNCFSENHIPHENGKRSGNIITYLMRVKGIDRGQALELFKFEIMNYDREEWTNAWKQEQAQMQSGKYSFDDTIDANGNIIKQLEEQQAALNEIDAQEHDAGAQAAAPDDAAADPGADPAQEQKAKPSFFMSATEYLHVGIYDAEMEYMRKFAGRRMGLHPGIDKHLTLYPGLAALGGQASLGKTTFAVNMVHKLLERGEHVLYFAFEQTRAEIFTKSIARQVYIDKPNALITNIDIKNGSQSKVVQKARQELEASGLFYNIVECDFNWTVADIKEVVKQYMHLYPGIKPVVIIDYLQLIAPPVNFRGSIREYTDENLKQLKGFQKDNGLFIVLISSFNRSSYLDPVSYDSFKETGMIESTCDYVWGLQLSILDPSNTNFYYRIGEKGGLYERTKAEKLQMIQRAQRDFPKQVQFVSLKSRAGKQSYKADFLYYPAYDFFKPNIYGITELPEYDPAQQEADDEQNTTPAQPVIIAPPR